MGYASFVELESNNEIKFGILVLTTEPLLYILNMSVQNKRIVVVQKLHIVP